MDREELILASEERGMYNNLTNRSTSILNKKFSEKDLHKNINNWLSVTQKASYLLAVFSRMQMPIHKDNELDQSEEALYDEVKADFKEHKK